MAILTDIIDERSHTYEKQYVNVYRLVVTKNTLIVEVGIHYSEDMYRDGIPPHRVDTLSEETFDVSDTRSLCEQAYVAIKNRWPDSTDC